VIRKERHLTPLSSREAEQIETPEPGPRTLLEAAETRTLLLRLINRLPCKQQEVVRLKFQNHFSYKEISNITNLSVSNVGFLIHTAVAQLRRDWAKDLPHP
jgi:RNA polymerase sigma-70 factor (ECF subfamily)